MLRLIFGIVLYLIASAIIILCESWIFYGLIAIVSIILVWEWAGLINEKLRNWIAPLIYLAGVGGGFLLFIFVPVNITHLFAGSCLIYGLIILAIYERSPQSSQTRKKRQVVATLEAIAFLAVFIIYTGYLYTTSVYLAYACFSLVCAYDSGGYLFGRWLNGKKMAPNLSPNKTFSGLIGGTFCVIAAYLVMALFISSLPLNYLVILLLAPFVVIVQCGDLYQSMLKRKAKLKDSGKIIPGHGGIFDRIDGLLWSSFPLYILIML